MVNKFTIGFSGHQDDDYLKTSGGAFPMGTTIL
jgi:hypothetical protein